jgi:4-amino-4-deoxy-L-arabinose transferase-like glycosyltransferase
MTRFTRYSSLVILLLLIAFFFRTYELAGLGLGLEHDEVAEWQIADGIRRGENALFFKEAYGQEPLYLYLMAGSTALIGDNVMAIRFTSVFVAMLTLAAAYRMLRRMFSPMIALIAMAGMSIALWPVFWGRVGLRAMTLPLMMCLAFDWLWRGLTADGGRRTTAGDRRSAASRPFVFAGIFFGLSAYTYLSSRALPILLAAFTVYLALFARDRMRGKWRYLSLGFAIAVIIALPLVITVLTNPDLQFRVGEVSEPLNKALQGDTREIVDNIPRALGMFTAKGDGTVRDNWPDRPVFPDPIGGLLFTFGFFIALTRFNQPRYVLAWLWIIVTLIPTIVTTGAPNFTRTLGALPMVFAMPGIAVEWLSIWPLRIISMRHVQPLSRALVPMGVVVLLIVFGINAISTYHDCFVQWPNHLETQFVFQADFAAIAKDIDASNVMDVSVGGLSNDTMDDPSLYLLRQRKDVRVRWFDSGSPISSGGALLDPAGSFPYIYVPSIVPFDPDLQNYPGGYLVDPLVSGHFTRYRTYSYPIPNEMRARGAARYFSDTGILLTVNVHLDTILTAGSDLRFVSDWFAQSPIAYPRRIFVHLVDPVTGRIIAQHDGLDSPTKYWQPNDYISQVHTLSIPADAAPGTYELRIGLYNPVTGQRVKQTDFNGTALPNDYYVLGTIEVTH